MPFRCRICGGGRIALVLDLPDTPLANALLRAEDLAAPERRYPLRLVRCLDCTLVQITETVPPVELFAHYLYRSSVSETVLRSAACLAERLIRDRRLGPDSLVIEVASNDGYLLRNYASRGIPALGIEPARNIAALARNCGVNTLERFFDRELAGELLEQGLRADVIHANNVLAHVADLHGVVAGLSLLLEDGGVAVVENHCVRDLIDQLEFDCVYHEHLCYYSVTALARLFAAHGLAIVDFEHIDLQGGSTRLFLQKVRGSLDWDPEGRQRVARELESEADWGVSASAPYSDFGRRVTELGAELRDTLKGLKAGGARIVAYGASAKSTTLLHTFGVGRETLEYVVDRSPLKQGMFTPGTHLPIHDPARLVADRPDYVLLLAWNLREEVMRQQVEYLQAGGRFVCPVPRVEIVPG